MLDGDHPPPPYIGGGFHVIPTGSGERPFGAKGPPGPPKKRGAGGGRPNEGDPIIGLLLEELDYRITFKDESNQRITFREDPIIGLLLRRT